jgi:hypothetical protein
LAFIVALDAKMLHSDDDGVMIFAFVVHFLSKRVGRENESVEKTSRREKEIVRSF